MLYITLIGGSPRPQAASGFVTTVCLIDKPAVAVSYDLWCDYEEWRGVGYVVGMNMVRCEYINHVVDDMRVSDYLKKKLAKKPNPNKIYPIDADF